MWHGWFGRDIGFAVGIGVEPFAYFFANNTACQALSCDDTGAVSRFLVVLVVNGLHDWMGHIQGGQIKQLKWAKFEANLVFQNAVDGGEICHAFRHNAQSFGAITTARMIDDETWRVVGLNRRMAHLFGKLGEAFTNFWGRLQACDYFNHFHERYGVEEVVARKMSRAL